MHSSTITAFLLPLLLSSVLAVPTLVQNGPTPVRRDITRVTSPPPYLQSISANLQKDGQSADAELVETNITRRKRSIIGRQDDNDNEAPPATDPNPVESGMESAMDQFAAQGMENEASADAAGEDPAACFGPCKRSIIGRQDENEAATTPTTGQNEELQQDIDASKATDVPTWQADIDTEDAIIGYEQSVGQDQQPGTT